MVGGRIISITPRGNGITQLWCVEAQNGSTDECAVDVRDAPAMPLVGDEIWWQSGKVYWDQDRRTLEKVGYSYTPTSS
jgi:hypothetical protein